MWARKQGLISTFSSVSQNRIPFCSIGTQFIMAQVQVNSALQVIPYFGVWVTSFTGYLDVCDSCWSLVRQRVIVRVTLECFCLS